MMTITITMMMCQGVPRHINANNQFLRVNHFDDQKDKIIIFALPDTNNDTNNGEYIRL